MNYPTWYAKTAGNDVQGLVIDETTGQTIAVAYDKKNTTLLAAAPKLLHLCKKARERLIELDGYAQDSFAVQPLTEAIKEAEENVK